MTKTGEPTTTYPLAVPRPQRGRLPFHRAGVGLRGRSLLLVIVASLLYLGLLLILLIPFMVLGSEPDLENLRDPRSLALGLTGVALMLPAALGAVALVGRRQPGTLSSVDGHLRWSLLVRSVPVCIAVVALVAAASLLTPAPARALPLEATGDRLVWLLALPVLLVPVQAAAEEYVFRGLLPQVIGAWITSPWIAYGVPTILFTLGHGYDPAGLVAVAVFGTAASWLTWRTGGLECAIALHVVNNLVAFGLSALGWVDASSTQVGWSAAVLDMFGTLLVTVLLWKWVIRPTGVSPY